MQRNTDWLFSAFEIHLCALKITGTEYGFVNVHQQQKKELSLNNDVPLTTRQTSLDIRKRPHNKNSSEYKKRWLI